MEKIEGTATFSSETAAQAAVAALTRLRHDDSNHLVGGAHDVRVGDDGKATITFSYRVRAGAAAAVVNGLEKQVKEALAGGKPKLTRGAVEMDDDEFFDESTQQLRRGRANRVLHTQVDEKTGETRTQTVVGKTRMARLVDEDGTEIGRVPVRSQFDEDGNKIGLPGPAGQPDPSVAVEKF